MNRKKGLTRPTSVAMELYPADSSDASCQLVRATVHTVLTNNGLSGFLSPLHSPEGDATKYHYHLMIVRPARHGFNMVTWRELANLLGAVNDYVMPLERPHKYARYLIHADDPDKIQYSIDSVITYGDLDYLIFFNTHDAEDDIKTDKNVIIIDILNYISKNEVTLFAQLVDYAIVNKIEWLPVIKTSTNFLTSYMRSIEYSGRTVHY